MRRNRSGHEGLSAGPTAAGSAAPPPLGIRHSGVGPGPAGPISEAHRAAITILITVKAVLLRNRVNSEGRISLRRQHG